MLRGAGTRLASDDRRSVASIDLGNQPRDEVIQITTQRSTYRITRRGDSYVTGHQVRGVVLSSSNREVRDKNSPHVWVDRVIRLGEPFHFGESGRSTTSDVIRVEVGGRRVLG